MRLFSITGLNLRSANGLSKLKTLLAVIIAAISFLACGKNKNSPPQEPIQEIPLGLDQNEESESTEPLKIAPEIEDDIKASQIFTINSLSEDVSRLSWVATDLELKGHEKLGTSGLSCQSPNQVTKFEELIYVVCSLSHQIFVYSQQMVLQKVIDVGNGSNPMELVIINENLAFVTLFNTDQVLVFRPKLQLQAGEQRVIAAINLKGLNYHNDSGEEALPKPAGIGASNGKVFVAVANLTVNWAPAGLGHLVVIDQESLQVEKILATTGYNSAKIVVDNSIAPEQKLYVLNSGSWMDNGNIDIYDLRSLDLIGSIATKGAPTRMVIDGMSKRAYIGDSSKAVVLEVNLTNLEILQQVNLQENRCNDFKMADYSYISDLLLLNEFLFVSEFNSDCLLVLEKSSLKTISAKRVGDGPLAIFNLD